MWEESVSFTNTLSSCKDEHYNEMTAERTTEIGMDAESEGDLCE